VIERIMVSPPIKSTPAAYRVAGLAERWECSDSHIYGLIRSGQLKAFNIGKLVRISAAEVARVENAFIAPEESPPEVPARRGSRSGIWIPPVLPRGVK
jgi:excisionase family DNA binding protein